MLTEKIERETTANHVPQKPNTKSFQWTRHKSYRFEWGISESTRLLGFSRYRQYQRAERGSNGEGFAWSQQANRVIKV